jgi:hypothetical protein
VASDSARAYLELPADERFETRIPALLKRHAESIASANGESLSQYVVQLLAERVAEDMSHALEWRLTAPEQLVLLRALSTSAPRTAALDVAEQRARTQFQIEMPDGA